VGISDAGGLNPAALLPMIIWNVWRLYDYRLGRWSYPSYVSWLACVVWNVCAYLDYDLPDRQWAYLVCLGFRGKILFTSDA
jgi:hypothetical protein